MAEDDDAKKLVQDFVVKFAKFMEDEQLRRAKEMYSNIEKMNTPTLEWLKQTCEDILNKRKTLEGDESHV